MRIDHNGTPQSGHTCRFVGMTPEWFFHYEHFYKGKRYELMFAPEMLAEYKWIFHHFLKEMEETPGATSILSKTSMTTTAEEALRPMEPKSYLDRLARLIDEIDEGKKHA